MLNIITGGAGFVSFNLAKCLLDRGDELLLIDNLSRGRLEYVEALVDYARTIGNSQKVLFEKADISDVAQLKFALSSIDRDDVEVWHLCANSDIPAGVEDASVDLRDTFLVTYNLLNEMKAKGWKKLHFSSTSAVYGDHGVEYLTEESRTEPISNYGAMKLASEAAIRAACEAFLDQVNVFRFPNVVGVPATHGVILDFIHKLKKDSTVLHVLGNGTQCKAYLHVSELIEAMLWIRDKDFKGYHVYNIGPEDLGVTVKNIAEAVRDYVSPSAHIAFGSGNRGWVGDVPRFSYKVDKLSQIGWTAKYSSTDAIRRAVNEISTQENGQ
jgi:UDP-glucose 4-epimerase